MNIFAERLKNLVMSGEHSQIELAKKLDISSKRLNSYITGRSEPGHDFVIQAADFFNTSTDYLLGRTNNAAAFAKHLKSAGAGARFLTEETATDEVTYIETELYESFYANNRSTIYGIVKSNSLQSPAQYNDAYALLIRDECMYPDYFINDMVLIERGKNERISGSVYALKLNKKDNIGLSLRVCTFLDSVIIATPLNKLYEPQIINLNTLKYDPVGGRPAFVYREYKDPY